MYMLLDMWSASFLHQFKLQPFSHILLQTLLLLLTCVFPLLDCERVFCTSHQPLSPGPTSTGTWVRLSQHLLQVLPTLPLQDPLSSFWSDPYTSLAQHPGEKSSCQWILPCCPPWGKKKIKGSGSYGNTFTWKVAGEEWIKRNLKKGKIRA